MTMKIRIRILKQTTHNLFRFKWQALCLLLLSPLCIASDDPEVVATQWMQRMSQAFQSSNYSLALIRIHKQQFEPILIEHALIEGDELVFIDHLNGPQRQALYRDNTVTFFQQDAQPYQAKGVRPPGPIPNVFVKGIETLKANYRFFMAGRTRNMGRPAQVIRIEPIHPDRYSYWLWMDVKTGMLLRLDTVSPEGEALEHVQIMSMNIVNDPTQHMLQLAQLNTDTAITLPNRPSHAIRRTEQWKPGWLPEGFEKMSSSIHRLAVTQELVDYQLYSDGLTNISIYVSKALGSGTPQAHVEQGPTMLYTFTRQGVEIAVVGQIPLNTAKRIANNLYPQKVGQVEP